MSDAGIESERTSNLEFSENIGVATIPVEEAWSLDDGMPLDGTTPFKVTVHRLGGGGAEIIQYQSFPVETKAHAEGVNAELAAEGQPPLYMRWSEVRQPEPKQKSHRIATILSRFRFIG